MESRRAVSSTVQASSFVVNKDGRVAIRWSGKFFKVAALLIFPCSV